ncbi:MAG: NAD-dependent protein deacetylase [Acidimicrobiia bacterium]
MHEPRHLAALVERGGVLVLSGAGLSTDSGIPDYRGPTGASRTGSPMTYRQFVDDEDGRRRYWARSHAGWRRIAEAEPNPGHLGVAALETAGYVTAVITQNVDELHRAGGSEIVLDLHGVLSRTVCLGCGSLRSRLELRHRLDAANPGRTYRARLFTADGDAELGDGAEDGFVVVDCLECGGILKPDVVFFGENVPRDRVDTAFEWLEGAASLVVLGSSLTVMSGYRFVLGARRRGIPVAIVNRGPTRGDGCASVRLDSGLSETLAMLAEMLVPLAAR